MGRVQYYFIMIPFLVFHCLVLEFLVYRITTYYCCFLNSIDFCTTLLLLTKYPNLEWAVLDQVDALWFWRLNIKTCLVKVTLEFKRIQNTKNNQAIYNSTYTVDTFQDFLIKLDIKPLIHLLEISIFSLNNIILRLTTIMKRADKNRAHF